MTIHPAIRMASFAILFSTTLATFLCAAPLVGWGEQQSEHIQPQAPASHSAQQSGAARGGQQYMASTGVTSDAQGQVMLPGIIPMPSPSHMAARELKLKIRELADQLLVGLNQRALLGTIALPASFVHQDNFEESSSFGRYIAEQMIYEFNQRGFPVREYRLGQQIRSTPGRGDFFLTRDRFDMGGLAAHEVLLVGTYYHDPDNLFVNARLIRAGYGVEGQVLRTGLVVFPQSKVSRRMLANTGVRLESAPVEIKDYEEMTRGTDLSDIDLGWDIR